MDRKRLLTQIPDALRPLLPQELRAFEAMQSGRLLKVYYEDPAFHFEVWFHESKGLVEVGYHGEGPAAANHLLLERLGTRLIDIKEALGPAVELEPWVRSWVRLCRMLPSGRADRSLLGTLVEFLARMIQVVQPLVADLAPARA